MNFRGLIKLGIWVLGFAENTSSRATFLIVIVLLLHIAPTVSVYWAPSHLTAGTFTVQNTPVAM